MTARRPKVATNSLKKLRAAGARVAGRRKDRLPEHSVGDRDPAEWRRRPGPGCILEHRATESAQRRIRQRYRRIEVSAEIGPRARMSATRPRRSRACWRAARWRRSRPRGRSAMMPEPTTVASSSAVPRPRPPTGARGGSGIAECAGARLQEGGRPSLEVSGDGVLRTAPSSPPQSAERGVIARVLARSGGTQGLEELLVKGRNRPLRARSKAPLARRSSTTSPDCEGYGQVPRRRGLRNPQDRDESRRKVDPRAADGGCGRA